MSASVILPPDGDVFFVLGYMNHPTRPPDISGPCSETVARDRAATLAMENQVNYVVLRAIANCKPVITIETIPMPSA